MYTVDTHGRTAIKYLVSVEIKRYNLRDEHNAIWIKRIDTLAPKCSKMSSLSCPNSLNPGP